MDNHNGLSRGSDPHNNVSLLCYVVYMCYLICYFFWFLFLLCMLFLASPCPICSSTSVSALYVLPYDDSGHTVPAYLGSSYSYIQLIASTYVSSLPCSGSVTGTK